MSARGWHIRKLKALKVGEREVFSSNDTSRAYVRFAIEVLADGGCSHKFNVTDDTAHVVVTRIA